MTIENFDTIKEKVLILLGLEDSEKLTISLEGILVEMLAYCFRDEVPDFAINTFAEVLASEYQRKQNLIYDGVTSYKEGDMSINFGDVSSTSGVKYSGKLEGFKLIRGITDVSE